MMRCYASYSLAILTALALAFSVELSSAAALNFNDESLPFTTFALEGSNGRYARLDSRNPHSNAILFDSQSLGERPRDATIFLLDNNGALTVWPNSRTQFGGYQAMQATNAGSNAVAFERANSSDSGYTPLTCNIDRQTLAFTCTIDGHGPSGGTISKARAWYLGTESGPLFSVKAVPRTPYEQSPTKHAHEHKTPPEDQRILGKELRV